LATNAVGAAADQFNTNPDGAPLNTSTALAYYAQQVHSLQNCAGACQPPCNVYVYCLPAPGATTCPDGLGGQVANNTCVLKWSISVAAGQESEYLAQGPSTTLFSGRRTPILPFNTTDWEAPQLDAPTLF
jgi:hypothetical protein